MIQKLKWYFWLVGLSGLFCAIKAKMIGGKAPAYFTVHRQDCKHPFRLRILSSDAPAYQQVFINQDYDFLMQTPAEVIIDAGANIGLASIYFANKFPDATIIAIEPEQSNFELLKENVAPYPNVIPVQAALWDKNEDINLIDPGHGKWGFMTDAKGPEKKLRGTIAHTVTAMTVDKIMQVYSLPKIDILKIDIEGAEKEVFKDTSAWLDQVDAIIIELHECLKPGCLRSFYGGSRGFDHEWQQGENLYLSRGLCLTRRGS